LLCIRCLDSPLGWRQPWRGVGFDGKGHDDIINRSRKWPIVERYSPFQMPRVLWTLLIVIMDRSKGTKETKTTIRLSAKMLDIRMFSKWLGNVVERC
jgi:hypothetical protein